MIDSPPPPPQFCIRMLKIKAQIARGSIKIPREPPGPFLSRPSGPRPFTSGFGVALVMCVRAHNLLRPPPHENPGSAPPLLRIHLVLAAIPKTLEAPWLYR